MVERVDNDNNWYGFPGRPATKKGAILLARRPSRRPHALPGSVAVRAARRVSLYNIGSTGSIWPHGVPHAKIAPAGAFAQWHATDSFTFPDFRRVI
ncbi:hypothetical protein [Burkholderia ubonensis]|uniref:hypothetical protein n=1 Tax=Burkholderia ubonensis TaxID=101571 RepID=UPI000AC316B1|nr:hypothetical protein [Burkholderia ubonensis]